MVSVRPLLGALETLTRLSEANYELVVVTSRQHVIQDVTLDWLDKHYSGLFQVCSRRKALTGTWQVGLAAACFLVLSWDEVNCNPLCCSGLNPKMDQHGVRHAGHT